jgi:ATP-dependent Clp protease ATP-binding subunit ClpB
VKEKMTILEAKAASAERTGDFEKAADLKYGAIPDLKSHLVTFQQEEEERKASQDEDSESVTPNDIEDTASEVGRAIEGACDWSR